MYGPDYADLPNCGCCGMPMDECYCHDLVDTYDDNPEDYVDEDDYPDYVDESMDGDHQTALASCGWGTDEDYGDFGGDDDWFDETPYGQELDDGGYDEY